jgi:hypothetical protein
MNWVSILGTVSIWIILLPLFIGLLLLKKLDADSRGILLIVLIGTIPQVLRTPLKDSTLLTVLYNVYTPLEFAIYWRIFNRKIVLPRSRSIVRITIWLFLAFSVFFIARFGLHQRFINEWVVINHLVQITWVCLCLLEYYRIDDTVIEKEQPFFWFLSGITCYAACTVVFYGLWYFIKSEENGQRDVLKIGHSIFNILLYCLFSIGLWQNTRSNPRS